MNNGLPANEVARVIVFVILATTCVAQSPIATEMLSAHNAVRARLKIPPLAWSDKLATRAQQWADNLLARKQFAHRPNSPYGENLFELEGAVASPAQVVGDWASESRDYVTKCLTEHSF
jgi:pathogenesis-related protein 1